MSGAKKSAGLTLLHDRLVQLVHVRGLDELASVLLERGQTVPDAKLASEHARAGKDRRT